MSNKLLPAPHRCLWHVGHSSPDRRSLPCLQYMGHSIANDTQYGGTMGPALAFRRLQKNVKGPKRYERRTGRDPDG